MSEQHCLGWILDVYIENDEAVIWIKTDNDKVLRLTDDYEPTIYILPRTRRDGEEIIQILRDLPMVGRIEWKIKLTSVSHPCAQELIHVSTPTISHNRLLLKILKHDKLRERIKTTFNNNLSHLQHYLFTRLKVRPSTKVSIEYRESKLVTINEVKDDDQLESPFSVMHVEVVTSTGQSVLDADDPIIRIKTNYEDEPTQIFEDNESVLLQQFTNYIRSKDPDIIVFINHTVDILSYLIQRIKLLSLYLSLGRRNIDIHNPDQKYLLDKWTQGRIYIFQTQIIESGVAGLIEHSKFSHLPIRQVLNYSIGRLIANRTYFELLNRDYVIPDKIESSHEGIRVLEEIVKHDKGGMIISPRVGLHENVAVLDFNDEFGNIIVSNNVSFETVKNCFACKGGNAILPDIVTGLLSRRSYNRALMNIFSEGSNEYGLCKQRFDALKKILVCIYGTTGSFWNKYGNVLAFEEINKKSREILLNTKDIAQGQGFEIVYADTDAAFVHKKRATRADYELLKNQIAKETGLSISLDYHYKFLVLLPLEADEKLEALKHYFGITYDNRLVTRGIETRRHDTPQFIKQFQHELLPILFDCNTSEQIHKFTLEKALLFLTKTIDRIMTGEVDTKELVISKKLGMDITKYKSIFPHVAAAIQQSIQNKLGPKRGDDIEYVYTDSQHQNPLNRVVTIAGIDNIIYDRDKYKEMLLDAAETLLGIFGFDRTVYGKPKDKRWREELRRSRLGDISAELISNES
jgi:DNA polymerase elongation subunit (family B)